MILPACVQWVDPSRLTGLAWLWEGGTRFFTDEWPFLEAGDRIEATCEQWGPSLTIGCETYKINPRLPQDDAHFAIEMIGVVRRMAQHNRCHLVWADPGDRLAATRQILTGFGWWPAGRKDAQSATQHLAAWCMRENCLPPRERAILSEVVYDAQRE